MTKSSHFVNLRVEVTPKDGKPIDITDSIDGFYLMYERRSPFPQITLRASMNTAKIVDYQIGFFTESYKITVETFDISRRSVEDSFSINCNPVKYPDLDLTALSKMVEDGKPSTNANDVEFDIVLINVFTEQVFNSKAYLWDNPVRFKEIWDKVTKDLSGWDLNNVDKPEKPDLKFRQFFLPYNRMYANIATVVQYGYYTGFNLPTFLITHTGLRMYNIKGAKKRRLLKTVIYPETGQAKDMQDIFVTDFKIDRQPDLKLKYGTIVPTLGVGQYRGDTKFNTLVYSAKHPAFAPGLFESSGAPSMEYHNVGLGDDIIRSSVLSAISEMNKLYITVNRWTNYEMFIPGKYLFDVKFSSKLLKLYSGKYYIIKSELVISRAKQEFEPVIKLELKMLDETSTQKEV